MVARTSSSSSTARLTYAAALTIPVVLGAALYPARTHLVPANLALLFVICSVVIAVLGDRGAAVAVAVMSGLSFDFFCTVPYLTLRMTRPQDITTMLLLVAVSLIVGQVAAGARQARTRAAASSERLAVIHALGQQVTLGSDPAFLVASVTRELTDLLGLRDCQFTAGDEASIHTRLRGDGSVTVGQVEWATERFGLPTKRVALPVQNAGQVLGTFILTPTPAWPIERERCLVAVALADELGSALAARTPLSTVDSARPTG